jgi:maltose O-acetyltransferase
MRALKLTLYYLVICRLPHSRYFKWPNKLRLLFLKYVLGTIREIGPNSYVEPGVYVGDGKKVSMGRDCQINENVFIQGAWIGNYVLVAPNVSILSKSHRYSDVSTPMVLQGDEPDRIPVIEDDVWLGRNVVVMPGVKIGHGSIVGAGAVVANDVLPYSVVGGVPARTIRMRK